MPDQIERVYTMEDLQVLQRVQVLHNNFVATDDADVIPTASSFVAQVPSVPANWKYCTIQVEKGGLVSEYSVEVCSEGVV